MATSSSPSKLTFPYTKGPDGNPRPYLWLNLKGSKATVSERGLLDTGADKTILPLPLAYILGYTDEDLQKSSGRQVTGSFDLWTTLIPIQAQIPDTEISISVLPMFTRGDSVLWGRDFMKQWDVCFSEKQEELTLVIP